MIKQYLKKISGTTSQGDAREESYYGDLSKLLFEFAESIGKTKIQITTLPKKTEAGNPDFRIWDGKQHIIGYIEAKKPGENLDVIETTDQLKRYRSTFPNLILTNYYEFRLFRNGENVGNVSIGREFIAKKLQTTPPLENEKKFLTLFDKFFSFSLPKLFTAESLAEELAKRTKFLRDEVISNELLEEEKGTGKIFGFYQAFKQYLVSNLTPKDFADIYSQTITYGLFAARTRANSEFNRKLAYDLIPQTIGILKDVFEFISLGKVPLQMEVIIDDIAEVLHVVDVNKILDEYYRKGKGEDPIVHFYETFLNIYDPSTREKRGVYYTPEPVVKYIVRAIHKLLKTNFELKDGLANKEVTLLDPAGGTLTFPAEAIKLAVEEHSKYGEAGKNKFIKNQILKNFYSFELMMAPYAIGHIKISFLLEELGYKMEDDDRFKLYLTNTLDMEDLAQTQIPGLESLSEESHKAANVKKNEQILVILGNPPYSGISANMNEWTEKLLKENIDGAHSYYVIDGKSLNEKKLWLQDDYVKFLRFAQWKIQKAGQGIVGMITNHSYLDNPTFRGMRQSLMKTFNEIYIIDLHGNSLKKETTPEGEKDENVFDIRQGTAIAIMLKNKNAKDCKVYHKDIYGLRELKYDWLEKSQFTIKNYKKLIPKSPWYFFIKRNTKDIEHYNDWIKVNEIFPVNVTGIVTARDSFVIGLNDMEVYNRILQFRNVRLDNEIIRESFNLKDTRGWKLPDARKFIMKDENWKEKFQKILYRPFDIRSIFFSEYMVDWGRPEYMQHMLKENISLCFVRQYSGNEKYSHALVSECMVDNRTFYSSKGIIQQAPLYLYESERSKKKSQNLIMLFEPTKEYGNKKPNIAPIVFEKLEKAYKKKPGPEQILYYVYAVLYSNVYREKYAEFLKIDFPRIPFTSDFDLFKKIAKLGEELTELHLLKSDSVYNPAVRYFGKGKNDKIEKVKYDEGEQRVYINDDKYFDKVESDIWNYHIGGYKVMEKYLKDRKGRQIEDTGHYCRIATAISKTIEIQKKIDKLFESAEEDLIEFWN